MGKTGGRVYTSSFGGIMGSGHTQTAAQKDARHRAEEALRNLLLDPLLLPLPPMTTWAGVTILPNTEGGWKIWVVRADGTQHLRGDHQPHLEDAVDDAAREILTSGREEPLHAETAGQWLRGTLKLPEARAAAVEKGVAAFWEFQRRYAELISQGYTPNAAHVIAGRGPFWETMLRDETRDAHLIRPLTSPKDPFGVVKGIIEDWRAAGGNPEEADEYLAAICRLVETGSHLESPGT